MTSRQYVVLQRLGQGAFGVVEKVKCKSTNQFYAMKKVKYMELKQRNKKNALNQIRVLSIVNHPNVIKFKQAFFEEGDKYLCTIMQLAPNGDLTHKIKEKISKSQRFQQIQIWKIGLDILKGLKGLHDMKIIHRDIKPANIFFTKDNVAKIGDLNVSIMIQGSQILTQTGTPYYASPQVWNHRAYGQDCDIWSFGCLIHEMCSLKKPFEAKNIQRLYQKINKLNYNPIPSRYSNSLQVQIDKCLTYKANRVTLEELIQTFQQRIQQIQEKFNLKADFKRYERQLKQGCRSFKSFIPKLCCQNPEQETDIESQFEIEQNISNLKRPYLISSQFLQRNNYSKISTSQKVFSERQISDIRSPLQIRQAFQFRSPRQRTVFQPYQHQIGIRKNRYQQNFYY